MIDDALKSTRTLHRLIIAVSVATLVFSLSLSLPVEQIKRKETISKFLEIDFLEYQAFVDIQVSKANVQQLESIGMEVSKAVDALDLQVFQLDSLAKAFSSSIHVGQVLVGNVALKTLSEASVTELNALNDLSLDQNVQVLVPEVSPLLPAILEFLREEGKTGKKLMDVQLIPDSSSPFLGIESFMPGPKTSVTITFQIHDAVVFSGAPVFQGSFDARVVELPGSSLKSWLERQSLPTDLVGFDRGRVTFLPELLNAPGEFTQKKLGELLTESAEEIEEAGPGNRSISILGTLVPGLLVVFASPLTLLALGYYFMNHTRHLCRVVDKGHSDFFVICLVTAKLVHFSDIA